MAEPALPTTELDFLREKLLAFPELECVTVEKNGDEYLVSILMPEQDFDLSRRLFKIEVEALESFPESGFDFWIWVRRGREWRDVISLEGQTVLRKPA